MTVRYVVLFRDLGYDDEFYSIGSGYDIEPVPLRETYATKAEAEAAAIEKSFRYICDKLSGRYGITIVCLAGEDGPASGNYPRDIVEELYGGEKLYYYNAPQWPEAEAKCQEMFGMSLVERYPQDIPMLHTVHPIEVP